MAETPETSQFISVDERIQALGRSTFSADDAPTQPPRERGGAVILPPVYGGSRGGLVHARRADATGTRVVVRRMAVH